MGSSCSSLVSTALSQPHSHVQNSLPSLQFGIWFNPLHLTLRNQYVVASVHHPRLFLMFSGALQLLLKFLVMSFQIKNSNGILMFMLLVAGVTSLCASATENADDYVRDACSVTRYNDICIHSLASYSNIAKRDPSKWARAGVSVTIGEAKHVAEYLVKLKNCSATLKGRNQVALSDCTDLFGDTLDNLHSSLGVLRNLSSETFESQMADVTSWMSAALTDEDTCLEGFSSREWFKLLQDAVYNVTYMTSNALALVNKLATSGLERLKDP